MEFKFFEDSKTNPPTGGKKRQVNFAMGKKPYVKRFALDSKHKMPFKTFHQQDQRLRIIPLGGQEEV